MWEESDSHTHAASSVGESEQGGGEEQHQHRQQERRHQHRPPIPELMERMESMEPISALYTSSYPEIQPHSQRQEEEPPPAAAPLYDQDLVHKTILVGDSSVGKTSLLVQFDQGKFIPGSFSATVGIGFTNKVVTVDGATVKLQIWDTAGQERFRSVTHAYYRDAHALLLLYDITNKSSFDNIRAWLTEIHEYTQSDVVIMLLGNKADMSSEREVKRDEGERLAREYSVPFMETSAKTGVNVDLAFTAVAKDLKDRAVPLPNQPRFQIHQYIESQKEKTSCCSHF